MFKGCDYSSSGCGAFDDLVVTPISQARMKEAADIPPADAMIEFIAGARGVEWG